MVNTDSGTYSTERQEYLEYILTTKGVKQNAAKVLVFLLTRPSATSEVIGRGTHLSPVEVESALRFLGDQGWIKERDMPT